MNPHEPLFWLVVITAIIALSFIMIACAMVAMAVFVNRAVKSVNRMEERLVPLMTRATELIQTKVIEPARELAAILAGLRRGLEVLVAPAPSPINSSYGDEEMFIG